MAVIYDPKAYLRGLLDVYREEVRGGLDFWAEHGMDWEKGGIVVYLDREGNWYLDEKQGWFTGRAMYSFARGYSDISREQRWLDAACNLYDFMIEHQFLNDGSGRLYHNMDREGNPCDSAQIAGNRPAVAGGLHDECFAVMGLAELYRATGREDVRDTLYRVFDTARFLYQNPSFYVTGERSREGEQPKPDLSSLMSLLCSTQTVRACDPGREEYYSSLLAEYVEQVFRYYYLPERKLIMEKELDCPGHSMEVAWFMLAEGLYTGDQVLVDQCAEVVNALFDLGWDREHGGFIVITNMEGKPAFDIVGNLKYWWPNNELELGLMYSYIGTGRQEYLERYRMVHEWIFAHFPDREKGEWYGYLNYDGTPLSRCKGDNQKGPYHLYRSFYGIHNLILSYLSRTEQ